MNNNKIKKIGVLTSGGDSPGMNAAVRSVVRTCLNYGVTPIGVYEGYDGLVKEKFNELKSSDVSNVLQRGGTIIYSARSKSFMKKEGRQKAFDNLKKNEIDALIVIGGDGTFTGAEIFFNEFNFPVIGIPGTIDNDIYGTDFTLGFDTALNTIVKAVDNIKDTAGSHNRLFFIEVMGRDAGFLALHSGISAGAEDILIPEIKTHLEDLILILKQNKRRGKTSGIIIVAEGDDSGGAYEIAKQIKEHDNTYSTRVSVLGHIQRGGVPTANDRVLGSEMGYYAVESLLKGKTNAMIGKIHNDYKLVSFEEAINNKHEVNKNMLEIARTLSI